MGYKHLYFINKRFLEFMAWFRYSFYSNNLDCAKYIQALHYTGLSHLILKESISNMKKWSLILSDPHLKYLVKLFLDIEIRSV